LTAAAVLAAGCPSERTGAASDGIGDPTTTGMDPGTTAIDEGSSSSEPEPEDVGEAGQEIEIKYDVGGIPDTPNPEDAGCRGIDFLFAIDNSGSMGAQQAQLLASVPGFIEAIQNSLEDVSSYHVGVISSDAYAANEPGCNTLGDLVTRTQAHGDCGPFDEGKRFATQQDDLGVVFPCMAEVGSGGSWIEQPVTGAIAAVSGEKAEPGACNEDFLRDDSILVLVIVTDDPPAAPDFDDAHPDTDTSQWYDSIIAAKGNNPSAVVVIGFIPWDNVSCVVFGIESPNLVGFVDSFGDQGIKASICEPDFSPAFASTIETIESTCSNFIPTG
jgi:hypothetical protein